MGPALFALAASVFASPFDLYGTVAAEGRAGSSPVLAGQEPTAFVAGLLTPHVEAVARDERLELHLDYFPRFLWQSPNNAHYELRPLILHQASLVLTGKPSATTDVSARGYASYGQPDYSILQQLIGVGQGALPQVQDIFTVTGNLGAQRYVTRRLRLTLAGDVGHFRVLDGAPVTDASGMALGLPHQTVVDATPGATFAVTRNDDFLLTATVAYGDYTNRVEIESVTPLVSWRERTEAGQETRLSLGLTYARDVGPVPAINGGSALLPTASGELHHSLLVQDDHGLWGHLKLIAEEYVDPILLTTGPRVIASGLLTYTRAPDWSVGLQGDFTASLRSTPLPTHPDETAFSIRIPARHRFSQNVFIEFGGFYGDRAPAFADPGFKFHQRQVWAYFSLLATTRDVPGLGIR